MDEWVNEFTEALDQIMERYQHTEKTDTENISIDTINEKYDVSLIRLHMSE